MRLTHQSFFGICGNLQHRFVHPFCKFVKELLSQGQNILATFTQRWQTYRNYVEAIIRGNAELLEMSGRLNDSDQSEVETIIRQVGRVKRIVSNLLTFAGTKKTVMRHFHIEALLEDILDQIGHQISLDSYRIERQFQTTGGDDLEGDEDQLRQVFTNLIVNGLQAMEAGGTVTVSIVIEQEAGLRHHGQ